MATPDSGPGGPPDRVADAAAALPRRCAATPLVPLRVWAAAVVLVVAAAACVAAVGAEGVPEQGLRRLHLPLGVGRAGASLYHTTMHYLMDQLTPSPSAAVSRPKIRLPARLAHQDTGRKHRPACPAGICMDPSTGAALLGIALVVKFVLFFAVSAGSSARTNTYAHPNITNIINVDTTNTVNIDTESGDQTQMQTQEMMEMQEMDQDQYLDQYIYSEPSADQDQNQDQDQELDQYQYMSL